MHFTMPRRGGPEISREIRREREEKSASMTLNMWNPTISAAVCGGGRDDSTHITASERRHIARRSVAHLMGLNILSIFDALR